MTTTTPRPILPTVIDLVRQAGAWLAAEFSRPDGPRFSDTDTSPIDTEIERFLRERLTALLPARFGRAAARGLAGAGRGLRPDLARPGSRHDRLGRGQPHHT